MWLSQKIKKDTEAKEALKDISKSIKKYSDATKITKTKFSSIDIGTAFRPNIWTYITAIIITIMIVPLLFYVKSIDIESLREILSLSLRISVPILVLGITLSNVIKSLDKESRFATEYIRESCRTLLFTCLTFLTVLAGIFAYLIGQPENIKDLALYVFFCFFAISTGGTIWCLMSQVYLIAVIIKCMVPETSTKMASNYAARETIHAFLIKTYNDIWMKKHSELLQEELHNCKKVFHYNDSYIKSFSLDNNRKYVFKYPQIVDSRVGYRDYNLRHLKKIEKLLSQKDAELYLEPNLFKSRAYGTLYIEKENQNIDNVKEIVFSKFREDKYKNEDDEFWDNHQEKIFNSIIKAFKEHDIAQFREYIISIESVFNAITQVRKNYLARKYSDLRRENYQFLKLYIRSLEWLLLSKKEEDEAVRDLFIKEITHSFDRQTDSYIENGDCYILDAFKWIIPNMYKQFEKHKDSSLWESRAKFGNFYYYAGYKLSDSELKITDQQKLEIQLTLHKGIISWLLTAIKNKDISLIKDLSNSAKRLVFPDKKIVLSQNDLLIQHLILCGKYLKLLSSESSSIDESVFKSLLYDEYDHNIEYGYTFNELIDFFIENRKNNPREYLREFCETDWQMRPLAGTGGGTPHYEFDGTEFDYAFIYLALLVISNNEEIRSIEFWGYSLKEKINIFEKAAHKISFYSFQEQKEIFEKWLDDCSNLYEEQEEQKVADADLKPENKTVFNKYFWDGYKERNTFLKFCIEQNHYEVEDIASTNSSIRLPKTLFLEDAKRCEYTGNSCGSEISHNRDNYLIYSIIKSSLKKNDETFNNIEDALNKSSQWLIEKGLREYEGIIVYFGNEYIEGKLLENEHFVPSWKIEKEICFSGYYKNFPIIKIHRQDDAQHFIALDLKGWEGIQVRSDIIENDVFGDIKVRLWTEKEIDEAIKSDSNLKEGDRNRLKGTCVADYKLYWQLNEENLPTQFSVSCNNKKDKQLTQS